MASMTATEARKNFSDAVNRVAYRGERIVLECRGKDRAALVPIADLERLQSIEDAEDLADAKAALEEKGGIPWKKIKKDLGL
jgi:prevent-host-death family protein